MKAVKNFFFYFSKLELILWSSSIILIIASFFIFDRSSVLTLCASLIGTTALMLCAKGNPIGQVLMIIFSIIYAIISFNSAYYGEMITYVGMSMPMAVISLISWLKNPYGKNRAEVKVNRLKQKEFWLLLALTLIVTFVFYFILKYLNTANLLTSTISVATSFAAVYLTARRSPFFALAYAMNDIVLIVLWVLAAMNNISYLSVIICFFVFLVNDIYGFCSWIKMQKRQNTP